MNRRQFVFCSACALAATAAPRTLPGAEPGPRFRCGTPPSTPTEDIQAVRVLEALGARGVRFPGPTVIPVSFHIIHFGAQGYLSHRRLKAQLALFNRLFATAGLAFTMADARLHENEAWFTHEPGSQAELEMKTELGKDTSRNLNIYTAAPKGLSGYASLPWSLASTPARDGIVIHHASLPEPPEASGPSPFAPGMTGLHQLGHWAGALPHMPGSPCEADGACTVSFTPEDYGRIRDMVGYYRFELSSAARGSALLAEIRQSIE